MLLLAGLRHWLGIPEHAPSWRERLIATLIAGIGVGIVIACSHAVIAADEPGRLWLVASIGASAVLVFVVPHGPLSQPWAVLGGQGVSALGGVLVAHWLGDGAMAAAVAVASAILAMQALHCVHPPGGATALAAIVATGNGHMPGWDFIAAPVLLNAGLLVVMAMLLNAPFKGRRYPLAWDLPHLASVKDAADRAEAYSPEELVAAFAELDAFVDISVEELQVLAAALQRARNARLAGSHPAAPVQSGHDPS